VFNWRVFLKYWWPAIVWMTVIFAGSSDSASFHHSSRLLAPLLHWLAPNLSPEQIDHIVYLFRKCCHLAEYAIMAVLFWWALRKPVWNDPRPWSWMEARRALLCVLLYASSDEFHQLFVPTREGRVTDVMIDTVGGAIGLVALWVVWTLWKRWRRKQ
jgi:VanZ family protein